MQTGGRKGRPSRRSFFRAPPSSPPTGSDRTVPGAPARRGRIAADRGPRHREAASARPVRRRTLPPRTHPPLSPEHLPAMYLFVRRREAPPSEKRAHSTRTNGPDTGDAHREKYFPPVEKSRSAPNCTGLRPRILSPPRIPPFRHVGQSHLPPRNKGRRIKPPEVESEKVAAISFAPQLISDDAFSCGTTAVLFSESHFSP